MNEVFSKFGVTIMLLLFKLDQEPKFHTIDEILIQSSSSEKELENFFLNDFMTSLNFNDIKTGKIQFLINKILNNESPYISYFEKLLKEKLEYFNIETKDLDDIDLQKKESIYLNKMVLSVEDLDFIDECLEYFVLKNVRFAIKPYKTPILKYINNILGVENILEEKLYNKYCNRRKKEICEYLHIKENELRDLFYFVFQDTLLRQNKISNDSIISNCNNFSQPINFLIKNTSYIGNTFPEVNETALIKMMSSIYYQLNDCGLFSLYIDEDDFDKIFTKSLNELLLINLRNNIMFDKELREWKISMITRLAEIENMDVFLTMLSESIFTNYLREYINTLNVDLFLSQKDNKIDNYTSIYQKTLNNKVVEIEELKKQIIILKENNLKLFNKVENANKKVSSIKKSIEPSYKKEISSLNKTIQNLTKKVEFLEQDNVELNEIRKTLLSLENEKEDEFDFSKIDLSQFKDMRYIFIGGRFELLKKLEDIFPKGKFYHMKPQDAIDISKTDKIIIFPKNINHPMYWDAINLAKKNKIPFMFTLGTNLETVIKDIINDLK